MQAVDQPERVVRSRCSLRWRPSAVRVKAAAALRRRWPLCVPRWWSLSFGSRRRRGLGECWLALARRTARPPDRPAVRSCTPPRLQPRTSPSPPSPPSSACIVRCGATLQMSAGHTVHCCQKYCDADALRAVLSQSDSTCQLSLFPSAETNNY